MAKLLAEKAEVENRNEMLERQVMALQADLVSFVTAWFKDCTDGF